MERITNQIQIISEDGNLVPGFDHHIKSSGMTKIGKDYKTVAIIGNQSTGKSTLLNKLFGTTFDVMDSSRRRQQTTKGILVSSDKEENILVVDVEGADSKERWEGHGPFEQSTALFSLVMSQVVIVNIWTQEVGRFTGSNYGILKVILENNLKLFKQEGKKNLVFVLRDFSESENEDTIRDTIRDDMTKIWNEINKPKEYASTTPDNFFNIHFVFLTNFKWVKDVFEKQCVDLRQRFIDKERKDYLFQDFDTNNNVPIDGLWLYMENVWGVIKDCKDINLPTQRTLVSNLRCTDIKQEVLQNVESKLMELKANVKSDYYKRFGEVANTIIEEVTKSYDEQTENYEKSVVQEKREELTKELYGKLRDVFDLQVSNIKKQSIHSLNQGIHDIKKTEEKDNYMSHINRIKDDCINNFIARVESCVLKGSDWDVGIIIEDVKNQIIEIVNLHREKQLAHLLKHKIGQARRDIEQQIISQLNHLDKSFWVVLENQYNETVRVVEDYIKNMLKESFQLDDKLVENSIKQLNDEIYSDMEKDLSNRFQELGYYSLKKFKNLFTKTENGIPVNWKGLDPKDIEQKYLHAREVTLETVKEVKLMNLAKRGETLKEKKPVIEEKNIENIVQRLQDDMEYEYKEAERKHASNDFGAIPKWFWLLLIFFGYDDILRFVQNPFLLYPLVLIGSAVFMMFTLGYGQQFNTTLKLITKLLRGIFAPYAKKAGIDI